MLTAQGAAELAGQYHIDKFDKILSEIETAAREGIYEIIHSPLESETIELLRDLGYTVYEDDILQEFSVISWEPI